MPTTYAWCANAQVDYRSRGRDWKDVRRFHKFPEPEPDGPEVEQAAMAHEDLPLVELTQAPVIYCKGLGTAEVIAGDLHCRLFHLARSGPTPEAPIVRAINLQVIMPVMDAMQALQMVAGVLGMDRVAKAIGTQIRRDGA